MVKIASILARGLTFAAFSFSTPFPVRRHLECLQLVSFRCATSAASAFIATLGAPAFRMAYRTASSRLWS
jgi:hypothetical protein